MELRRTPAGRRWVVAAGVDAPADRVWDLLVDTERWPEWGPTVAAVESPTRRIEAGTAGRVEVRPLGVRVPFEISRFDEAGRRWHWAVARLPATGHHVAPTGEGCRVEFEIPLAAGGYAPVCRRACRNIRRLAKA
jgi:hypothetical protein